LSHLFRGDRVLQRPHDRFLADHLVEALGAVLAVEGGHRTIQADAAFVPRRTLSRAQRAATTTAARTSAHFVCSSKRRAAKTSSGRPRTAPWTSPRCARTAGRTPSRGGGRADGGGAARGRGGAARRRSSVATPSGASAAGADSPSGDGRGRRGDPKTQGESGGEPALFPIQSVTEDQAE